MTRTITLFGDSIFDNGTYAAPGPSLSRQVGELLPDWTVDMRAVDGAPAREILFTQLDKSVEQGVMVLSAGGNDALNSIHYLGGDAPIDSDTLWRAAHDVRQQFRSDYTALLEKALSFGLPLAVCTIYNPTFHRDPKATDFQRLAECGLAFFNDIIVHEAMRRRLHIIDLRDVCTSIEDFANPIEPSSIGGRKIAAEVCTWVIKSVG